MTETIASRGRRSLRRRMAAGSVGHECVVEYRKSPERAGILLIQLALNRFHHRDTEVTEEGRLCYKAEEGL
jgi:hypothetical protein